MKEANEIVTENKVWVSTTIITPEKEVKETTTSKRPVSSGRSRSGSSRPITGYGKSRTSTSDENGNLRDENTITYLGLDC